MPVLRPGYEYGLFFHLISYPLKQAVQEISKNAKTIPNSDSWSNFSGGKIKLLKPGQKRIVSNVHIN
jgi:hypothetical protein